MLIKLSFSFITAVYLFFEGSFLLIIALLVKNLGLPEIIINSLQLLISLNNLVFFCFKSKLEKNARHKIQMLLISLMIITLLEKELTERCYYNHYQLIITLMFRKQLK